MRFALPERKDGWWQVAFTSPTPPGAEYLGRNHPFVAALARFLFEEALTKSGAAHATRGGVIATHRVTLPTVLLLLRVRYLIHLPNQSPLFSEEVRAIGYTKGEFDAPKWLPEAETLHLLAEAKPNANVPLDKKKNILEAALKAYPSLQTHLHPQIEARATDLTEAHKRIRKAVRLRVRELTVEAQYPLDLLGLLVLTPA
ncbi:MAG: hypothetical protein OHK0052_04130 [Anaerolineales bacterium]